MYGYGNGLAGVVSGASGGSGLAASLEGFVLVNQSGLVRKEDFAFETGRGL